MCIDIVSGKNIIKTPSTEFQERIAAYSALHLDIGAGDGAFFYRQAKEHSPIFFVAIEPCAENLIKFSRKVLAKPGKGGVNNLVYVRSLLEDIPEVLNSRVDHIYLNYPWASLLKFFIEAEPKFIETLLRVGKKGALCDVLFNCSIFEDKQLIQKLNLPQTDPEYILELLTHTYSQQAMQILVGEKFDGDQVPYQTSWGKHLTRHSKRKSIFIRLKLL